MRNRRLLFLSIVLALVALLSGIALPGCSSKQQDQQAQEQQEQTQQEALEEQLEEVPIEDGDTTDEAEESEATTVEETTNSTDDQGSIEVLSEADAEPALDENGTYTSKDEVAWYLHTYGHLPSNYITKDEAEDAGWKTRGLSLAEACPGKSIGGSRFGNREKRLPTASGRVYYECDIDYNGERGRNAKRIVYSNDGLIYYTEDHYKTFEQLY